jgi:hypothetical protein
VRFRFVRVEALPPLAWHARLRAGDAEIEVTHGPRVETRADAFVEGAWDGPYERFGFDEAITFTGSGGRATEAGAVFATSTSSLEPFYLARRGELLHVSNSLPFLLVMTGGAPDPRFPYYEDELQSQARMGVKRSRRSIPSSGGPVTVHECADLLVGRDLGVVRREKRAPPAPRGFDDYEALLCGTIGRVLENARDPARGHRYEPIATVSSGYDSGCVAALARRHGCRKAITFAEDEPGVPDPDDGTAVGRALGLDVVRLARRAPSPRPHPEAEFCVCPPGGDRVWLSGEDHLAGRMLLTGRGGDAQLGTSGHQGRDLARDRLTDLGGATLREFRLRAGTIQFAPLYVGWQHGTVMRAIARSETLRPWSVGGDYDRPVARRILEEAGVPREAFGMHKRGGAYLYVRAPKDLCPASRDDYFAFLRELRPSPALLRRMRLLRAAYKANRDVLEWFGVRTSSRRGVPGLVVPRRYHLAPKAGFLFHWGFARMSGRYRP